MRIGNEDSAIIAFSSGLVGWTLATLAVPSQGTVLNAVILTLVAGGLVVGTAVAIACARTVRTLLYGINPIDPLTLIIAIVGLLTIALAASLLPAIRAASVDPIQALREE